MLLYELHTSFFISSSPPNSLLLNSVHSNILKKKFAQTFSLAIFTSCSIPSISTRNLKQELGRGVDMEPERCYSVSQTKKTQLLWSCPNHSELWGQKSHICTSGGKFFISDALILLYSAVVQWLVFRSMLQGCPFSHKAFCLFYYVPSSFCNSKSSGKICDHIIKGCIIVLNHWLCA